MTNADWRWKTMYTIENDKGDAIEISLVSREVQIAVFTHLEPEPFVFTLKSGNAKCLFRNLDETMNDMGVSYCDEENEKESKKKTKKAHKEDSSTEVIPPETLTLS